MNKTISVELIFLVLIIAAGLIFYLYKNSDEIFSLNDHDSSFLVGTASTSLGMSTSSSEAESISESSFEISSVGKKLIPPSSGIYHGAFPYFGPQEDDVTQSRIDDFVNLAGTNIVWGYFSDNWFDGINFPREQVIALNENGIVPFIRLMPRSRFQNGGKDPVYTLQKIIDGDFDTELRQWAKDAKDAGVPLLIEFGTEVNGNWFTWSGRWNGANSTSGYGDPREPDGPERFKDAYRHIIDIFRSEEANDITWFFHINLISSPDRGWNKPNMYYPGDDYIDWIGVSVYGAQDDKDKPVLFSKSMEKYFSEIEKITSKKPIAIVELGTVERGDYDKAIWISDALQALISGKYKNIKGVAYWHSSWVNNNGFVSDMRINSSEDSLLQYKILIQDKIFVTEPLFSK